MLTIAKIIIGYGYNSTVRFIVKNNPFKEDEFRVEARIDRKSKIQQVEDYLSSLPSKGEKEIIKKDVEPLWDICGNPDVPFNEVKTKVRFLPR